MNNILITFIKNPQKGKVKTRLAASIGEEKAFVIYNKLTELTRIAASEAKATNWLFYDNNIINDDLWSNEIFSKKLQVEGNLGARMEAAFKAAFEEADKVVIIGSDCPEIDPALINEAFTKLELADVVIGPSKDGGYYLLGMNNCYNFLFQEMPWSTERLRDTTIEAIQAEGLLYTQLKQLSDVDYYEDLLSYPDLLALIN